MTGRAHMGELLTAKNKMNVQKENLNKTCGIHASRNKEKTTCAKNTFLMEGSTL